MHSHDRTLLAKLGFSDPDKKLPLHDMACAYLGEKDQAEKIACMMRAQTPASWFGRSRGVSYLSLSREEAEADERSVAIIYDSTRVTNVTSRLEAPIMKGAGQYQSVIGFADVVVAYFFEAHDVGWSFDGKREPINRWERLGSSAHVLVEVKIAPCSIGDVLRQMKLYGAHQHFDSMVLATAYPVSRSDVSILRNEGIRHVMLGEGFKSWCQRPTEDSDSVQF